MYVIYFEEDYWIGKSISASLFPHPVSISARLTLL
jgi:hypothetical protein